MDIFSKEIRSKTMSKIKAKSRLEDSVCSELWKRGIRFRRNVRTLYGTPDIAIKKYKVVIFIDSCFWHHCPIHGKFPKSNEEFWSKKLNRNMERDAEVNSYYHDKGWNIKRIWEHELKQDFLHTVDELEKLINRAKESSEMS